MQDFVSFPEHIFTIHGLQTYVNTYSIKMIDKD